MVASDEAIETLLAAQRAAGASPITAIKAVRDRFGLSLAEGKQRLHASAAWRDLVPSFEAIHDAAEQAAKDL